MKVIYFGTPSFAANVLDFLLKEKIDVVAVVTKPDKAMGRSKTPIPTPVKEVAVAHRIPFFQPEIVSAPYFASTLSQFEPDLFVVVAYGEILKQHILEMPKIACINLHASLLPKYRGAAPIQKCILEGEKESGVTIMHMEKKMDAGDIIRMVKTSIGPDMTYGELQLTLQDIGRKALLDTILDFEKGIASRTPQDHTLATFAPKIELEDCEIKWSQPAEKLHNLVRGVNPEPGAWCKVVVRNHTLRLKINKTAIKETSGRAPGEILEYGKKGILVACGIGALELTEVQLEGKKAMTGKELSCGIPQRDFAFITLESNS